jgi:RNA polymerase sigma factor (sigma-70 family)
MWEVTMTGLDRAGEWGLVVVERAIDLVEFQRIYRQVWPDVYRYALLLSRHRQDAEDIAADAFRRALEAWSEARGPRGEVTPWLFVIVRRIVIDRHRRSRLFRWLPLEGAPERGDPGEEAAFRSSEVWIWFEQLCRILPPAQREALILRFQFDLSDVEASKVMGTSVGTVRTLVSRGVATLRVRAEGMER